MANHGELEFLGVVFPPLRFLPVPLVVLMKCGVRRGTFRRCVADVPETPVSFLGVHSVQLADFQICKLVSIKTVVAAATSARDPSGAVALGYFFL
jgi:hypothetical protein